MIPADTSVAVQQAVSEYFGGEFNEMLFILVGSALLVGLAAWLWIATRSGFAKAFGTTVLVAAALFSATAVSLMVRDKDLSNSLVQVASSPNRGQVVAKELERIDTVVSKYPYYRYGAAVFAALSVMGLLLTRRGWVHGIAAGLLLVVAAQVVIDHFSEQRARQYLSRLSAATDKHSLQIAD